MTLAQKGMLFIAVPMFLQLFFTVNMAKTVERTQTIASFEFRSKALIGNINWIMVSLAMAYASALDYEITERADYQQTGTEWLDKANASFAELGGLPPRTKEGRVSLQHFLDSAKKLQGATGEELKKDAASDTNMKASPLLSQDFNTWLHDLFMDRRQLLKNEREALSVTMQDLPVVQKQLTFFTQGAVVFTFGLTIYLVYVFNVQIAKRLAILSDNTVRLSKGMPLNEPQVGTDEIARLDAFFRKMADELTASKLELELSEQRLRNLIENLPVGLLTLDEHQGIRSINVKATEMFLTPVADAQQMQVQSLIPSIPPSFISDAAESFAHGQSQVDIEMYNAVGKKMFLELTVKPNQFRDENVQLLTINDITERKNMEQLREDFLNMVTHDLRSPLASIGLTHQLLLKAAYGALSDKAKDKLEKAERNIQRLIRLINDLLDFEKMRSGSIELQPREMNSDSLVALAVESVLALADQKKMIIKTPELSWKFVADEGRLVQVLTNLLGNAIKFSNEGEEIEISIRADERFIEFRVKDQGRGIPAEKRDAIFEKYKQVSATDHTEKGGTGLGLPICKLIVEMHGGSIGVESEIGQGSTFYFKLPREQAASVAA